MESLINEDQERHRIRVSGIDMRWDPDKGTCTFEKLPVAMMWVDTTLAGLMSGVQAMVGTERFTLALQSEGRKSVETDWQVISKFADFQKGFKAIATIAAVAGWGRWELISLDEEQRECRFRVEDCWEGRYQKALGVCWGSGMLAGKLAGYCSKLFMTNCWAEQTAFLAQGDEFDEFIVRPSSGSTEKEIENLLTSDEATRADMAVALRKLDKEIAERKQAEEALRESEEKYRNLVENSLEGIGISQGNHIIFANRTLLDIFGYDSLEEFIKIPLLDHVAPESRNLIQERLKKREQGEFLSPRYEYKIIRKDGAIRDIEISSSEVVVKEEKCFQSTFRDISERKRVVEELRASEDKYRVLVENAGEAIFVAQNGVIKYVNAKTKAIFGYPEEETSSRPFIEYVHPDDRALVLERHTQRLQGKDLPPSYNFRIVHSSGDMRWVELNVVAINWAGKPATLNFMSDISERKRAEAEKEYLQEQLLQAQKMESVGRLAGGVAHDFNNMLTVIIGHTEMALIRVDSKLPLHNDLQEILQAAKRSADLTRQLLAFARKQTVKPKIMSLNKAVSEMLKMLQRLIGENIDLTWRPGVDLWQVKIDPSQIDQILANLVVNARDSIISKGNISIETANVNLDTAYCTNHVGFAPGEYILLAVSDNGCGMDKETMSNIFEPFFTTKGVGKGTGLGLATVYGIVNQNGGIINVSSEPGQGTTFTIYLPRYSGNSIQSQREYLTGTRVGGTETVLLVEDETSILIFCKRLLEGLGYTVLTATTPGKAIYLAGDHIGKIHLLITDMVMPEMNGRELAERLVLIKPGLKCLFMSGYPADIIAHHGILEEGVSFIQKPFSMEELAEMVRGVLDRE